MSCKDLRRRHRAAVKAERLARAEVRAANAKVVELTTKLAPSYVETTTAKAQRNAVKPFVEKAQAASSRWWHAADELSNLSAAVASCKQKR